MLIFVRLNHSYYEFSTGFRYLAPEYFMHGIVDEKTDVFAFGVLLLEIITGRHAVDNTKQSLVTWVWLLLQKSLHTFMSTITKFLTLTLLHRVTVYLTIDYRTLLF